MKQRTAPPPPRRIGKWLDGGKLRTARKAARFTQAQLAALVGTTQQTVGHLEAGDEGWGCDLETAWLFAVALEVPPSDLMHEDARESFAVLAATIGAKAA